MTHQNQTIDKLLDENKLKEFDTIDVGFIGFYRKNGTNIIKHNISPTLITKNTVAVVLKEESND